MNLNSLETFSPISLPTFGRCAISCFLIFLILILILSLQASPQTTTASLAQAFFIPNFIIYILCSLGKWYRAQHQTNALGIWKINFQSRFSQLVVLHKDLLLFLQVMIGSCLAKSKITLKEFQYQSSHFFKQCFLKHHVADPLLNLMKIPFKNNCSW